MKLSESWYKGLQKKGQSSVKATEDMYKHCVGCKYFTPENKEQLCQHDPDTWDPETCYQSLNEGVNNNECNGSNRK